MTERALISIVDDDDAFGESLRRLLRSLNYSVVVFSSGAKFLASRELHLTACLVADIHMPSMSGVELYEALIEQGHLIPTILVTAYPDERVRQRMLERGVQCYLNKPLVETVLMECLGSAMARDASGRF